MFYRMKRRASGLGLLLEDDQSFSFESASGLKTRVTLRSPTAGDPNEWFGRDSVVCEASCEHNPNETVFAILESLALDQMLEGSTWQDDLPTSLVDNTGKINPNCVVPMRWMPENLASYSDFISDELARCSQQAVHTMRWRIGAHGPHTILRGGFTEFSHDQQVWRPFPRKGTVPVEGQKRIRPTDDLRGEIHGMLDRGNEEPIGHLLWNEPWYQRHENPRSAIVIAIAAAEAAIKRFVAEHVPEAQWLVENMPSPPITRLYAEYLPELVDNLEIETAGIQPSDQTLDILGKGVWIRNRIVHIGDQIPSYDTVEDVLISVLDLLWILDRYDGNSWAQSHIGELKRLTGRAL